MKMCRLIGRATVAYDLFKQWTSVKRPVLEGMLGSQFILYNTGLQTVPFLHRGRATSSDLQGLIGPWSAWDGNL
jgi:hypothetical protein